LILVNLNYSEKAGGMRANYLILFNGGSTILAGTRAPVTI